MQWIRALCVGQMLQPERKRNQWTIKMLKKVCFFFGIPILAVCGLCFFLYHAATRLPDNRPLAFQHQPVNEKEKRVICVGDSLTHGRVSHNYVADLAGRYTNSGYRFVNAGINSELAYNVRQRIGEVIALKPDYVTLLIGTNDALAAINPQSAQRYVKKWHLPQIPDKQWFRENLASIVARLQTETQARIALISLPPITEEIGHPGYRMAREYSAVIREVAEENQLPYLSLNEMMAFVLEQSPSKSKRVFSGHERGLMYKAIVTHYFFRHDWDRISERNGFFFLTDFIHLNARGAGIVADLIDAFLRHGNPAAKACSSSAQP